MKDNFKEWHDFIGSSWRNHIDVANFIKSNYQPYLGDENFLMPATARTKKVLKKLNNLQKLEQEFGGVLDINTNTVSSLASYEPGYLDKDNEIIVGLQTDRPLKRGINPFGGIRMAKQACEAYGYRMSHEVEEQFMYRTTHNEGVFRVYTDEMRLARKIGIVTGLPDSYGRGRIIGDYRRVALYGVDYLIAKKQYDKANYGKNTMDVENIRHSEELFSQIDFLGKLKEMANQYGFDISKPAANAKEAVQWLYFGYLAAIKEQNGAAMSLGRVSNFIDIYIERDIKKGILDENSAQELIDDFVLKLRCARHLRTPEYNELFGGDPMWITECEGGITLEGKPLVTKSSYRFLHTLYNLGTSPEPNLTILWSKDLPENFKKYCAKVSIDTDSIQYENDDLMRLEYGDDYAIACCVSAMKIGKQMQFFGARCNLPKLLLIALNGGRDENTGLEIGPQMNVYEDELLDYDKVMKRFVVYREWLCRLYVNTMNVIHYMHDKYALEKIQMALHDSEVERFMAFGIAGLSILTDSLSAVKFAKVKTVKDDRGLIVNFEVEG
ncbi:MAG: pyruvate formate lyase family protein, partial [Clostridia bacterium]|nr:pyruvate formate lyase family protein [Clostridia bacterium]